MPYPLFNANYDTSAFRKALGHACEQAGIKPFTPHQLRHSALVAHAAPGFQNVKASHAARVRNRLTSGCVFVVEFI